MGKLMLAVLVAAASAAFGEVAATGAQAAFDYKNETPAQKAGGIALPVIKPNVEIPVIECFLK